MAVLKVATKAENLAENLAEKWVALGLLKNRGYLINMKAIQIKIKNHLELYKFDCDSLDKF